MPQSLSRVLIHLIFSTKNRARDLTLEIQNELHPYLATVLRDFECPVLKIGGIEDHVHSFFGLSRTRSISEVVEHVKISSSKWLKTKSPTLSHFHWQSGYGAFSVGQSSVDALMRYIAQQAEHHKRMTFQDEFRRFLNRYQIAYDERYVWD